MEDDVKGIICQTIPCLDNNKEVNHVEASQVEIGSIV